MLTIDTKLNLINAFNTIFGLYEFKQHTRIYKCDKDLYLVYGNYFIRKIDIDRLFTTIFAMLSEYNTLHLDFMAAYEETFEEFTKEVNEKNITAEKLYYLLINEVNIPEISHNDILTAEDYIDCDDGIYTFLLWPETSETAIIAQYSPSEDKMRYTPAESSLYEKFHTVIASDITWTIAIMSMDNILGTLNKYFSKFKIVPHPALVKTEIMKTAYSELAQFDPFNQTLSSDLIQYAFNKVFLEHYAECGGKIDSYKVNTYHTTPYKTFVENNMPIEDLF